MFPGIKIGIDFACSKFFQIVVFGKTGNRLLSQKQTQKSADQLLQTAIERGLRNRLWIHFSPNQKG